MNPNPQSTATSTSELSSPKNRAMDSQAADPSRSHEGSAIQSSVVDQAFESHLSSVYWSWKNLVESDAETTAVQIPDFVLMDVGFGTKKLPTQIVYEETQNGMGAIAILAPSFLRSRKYTVLTPRYELPTYRLVGSRIFGDSSEATQQNVIDHSLELAAASGAMAISLEDTPLDAPAWKYLDSKLSSWTPAGTQLHHQIRFPETASDYWDKFNSKTRKKFRKRIRQFGDHEVRAFTDSAGVADFLRDAHEISRHSWKTEEFGLCIQGSEREEKLLTTMAMAGALRSYVLYHEGVPVAFELAYQHGNQYIAEDAAYDGRYASKSPGQVLQLLVLEDLCENRTPRIYDFGFGEGEYKTLFSNHTFPTANVLVPLPGLAAGYHSLKLKSAVRTERALRRVMGAANGLMKLRQWRRRTGEKAS